MGITTGKRAEELRNFTKVGWITETNRGKVRKRKKN